MTGGTSSAEIGSGASASICARSGAELPTERLVLWFHRLWRRTIMSMQFSVIIEDEPKN
ncbi:MAG: hypothetical protein QM446_01660 [Synergistota bacterium]|nr:hypothetical protein [Synergistota bacterium]